MNFVELFQESAQSNPDRMALWAPGQQTVSFSELRRMAASAQALCRENGVGPEDYVLLMDRPGPHLYASLLGTVATGACAVIVEPWVSLARIEDVLVQIKPKACFLSTLAKVLGLRSPAVRSIPNKINPRSINQDLRGSALEVVSVEERSPAILTFTSTSDAPARAILRRHGPLQKQLRALAQTLGSDFSDGSHLSLFTNTTLSHLCLGKTSLLMPQRWTGRAIRWIEHLPQALAPVSLHCSPGFLENLMERAALPTLRKIHLSRAVSDCALLEKAFGRWPDTEFQLLYGSSESEPLASIDAKESTRLSRAKGYVQALALGHPCPDVEAKLEQKGCWVQSPYLYSESPDTWHFTGDRIEEDQGCWWYKGRASVPLEDFQLEQRIYSFLNSTECFVHRDRQGLRHLIGQNLGKREDEIKKEFLEIHSVVETPIHHDRRHRSWINRRKTLRSGAAWLTDDL